MPVCCSCRVSMPVFGLALALPAGSSLVAICCPCGCGDVFPARCLPAAVLAVHTDAGMARFGQSRGAERRARAILFVPPRCVERRSFSSVASAAAWASLHATRMWALGPEPGLRRKPTLTLLWKRGTSL